MTALPRAAADAALVRALDAVADACAELLRIDVEEAEHRSRERRRRRETETELARLEALGAVIEQDLDPFFGADSDDLRAVAGAVAEALRRNLQATRAKLVQRARGDEPAPREPAVRAAIERAVAAVVAAHDLPGARWELSWQASSTRGGTARAAALCTLAGGLSVAFADHLGPGDGLSRARVGDLARGLRVPAPELRDLAVDRWSLDAVDCRDGHRSVCARDPRRDGARVTIDLPAGGGPAIARVGADPIGLCLDPDGTALARHLWDRTADRVLAALRRPERVTGVWLHGHRAGAVARPKHVAGALLACIDEPGAHRPDYRRALHERLADLVPDVDLARDDLACDDLARHDLPPDDAVPPAGDGAAYGAVTPDAPYVPPIPLHDQPNARDVAGAGDVDEDAPTGQIRLRLPLPPR
ncbi:MAG: hypothetical protein D6689_19550 [Deltaproteobacteria bacterium]|nr:MAG: hypothetical protein D6689_19550 [Deltaproteobacteria bacterium]